MTIKLFLTIWLVYAVYATPAGGVQPNRYIDLVHAVVKERHFEIDTYHENTTDKVNLNGHYYVAALPGPSILAIPLYVAFQEVYEVIPDFLLSQAASIQSFKKPNLPDSSFYGKVDNVEFFFSQYMLTIFLVGALAALGATFLFILARQFDASASAATLTALAYAFGTHAFFFSVNFFEQIVTASFGIISFSMIHLSIRRGWYKKSSLVALGALSGLLVLSEYFGFGLLSLFFLYLAYHFRDRRTFFFAAGIFMPLLFLLVYNYLILGNPFDSPYMHLGKEFDYQMKEGIAGMSYPRPERALAVLFGIEKGLFVYAPILVLSIVGVISSLALRQRVMICVFCCTAFFVALLYNASFCCWYVTSFGPKYLVNVLPLLVLPLAFIDWTKGARRLIFMILIPLSIFINWTGAQFGFAESVIEHIEELITRGPTLPVLDAIITHSASQSQLYLFVAKYHALVAGGINLVLLVIFAYMWRELWVPWARFRARA